MTTDRRAAERAFDRAIRPTLEADGFAQDRKTGEFVRTRELGATNSILLMCSWFWKAGRLEGIAGMHLPVLAEFVARHRKDPVQQALKPAGFVCDFMYYGMLKRGGEWVDQGRWKFEAGADPQPVAQRFIEFYSEELVPVFEDAQTPGGWLRIVNEEVGAQLVNPLVAAAAAILSEDPMQARGILEVALLGHEGAERRGYSGVAPGTSSASTAESMLREMGIGPQEIARQPQQYWPDRTAHFFDNSDAGQGE